jgi:hypothetical protein
MTAVVVPATPPVTRRIRAYFAPVDRAANTPTLFDPAQSGRFNLDAPPSPWRDLGWCAAFARKSGTKIAEIQGGAPAMVRSQVRTEVAATVSLRFASWGKLQLGLASGSQQMNLLRTAFAATANGSGGVAASAVPLTAGGATTASQLDVGAAAAANFGVGSLVAVDVDYVGQLGFVGSGVAGGYVRSASAVENDANYIRRVTWNVGQVVAVSGGLLQLAAPLIAGAPSAAMKVCSLSGFVDREGGSFFQEWSGLFVLEGQQGDRVLFHYPRLQAMEGSGETYDALAMPLEQVRLQAAFRALPVNDAQDGEPVLCFRTYLPAAGRAI